MTLEEALKEIGFSTAGVSAENFKKSAVSVNFFEISVRRLNLDTVKRGFTAQSYDSEKGVYVQAKRAYENLSSLALMNVSNDSLKAYETYSKLFAIEEAKFGKTLNLADEFCKEVKSLSVFALKGNQIPTINELYGRNLLLSDLEAKKQSLQEGKASLPQDVINKLNELRRNIDVLLVPWKKDFTGNSERKDGDGNFYSGEFVNGKPHGDGKMCYSDGNVYKGSWKNGCRNGNGMCTYSSGDEYKGEWADDERNGFGKMTYCRIKHGDNNTFIQGQKSIYLGHWKSDKIAPTVSDRNYADARNYFDKEDYKSAQCHFEDITEKSNYPDIEKYIQICKDKLAEIERKRAEEKRKKEIAAQQKRDRDLAEAKRKKVIKRKKIAKQSIVDIVLLMLAVGLEFLALFLFERYAQKAYLLLVTPLLWLLYSSYTEKIEDLGHDSNNTDITIAIKVIANFINAGVLTTFIFVFTNPERLGWTIVMLIVNTVITIALSISSIVEFVEESTDGWNVIALIIGYIVIAASYILNKELIDYYCNNSSFWHTLWVLPVVQVAMTLLVFICWRFIRYDMEGGIVMGIVIAMGVVNFVRAMVVVWAFKFSFGMFFFGVLALIIQSLAVGLSILIALGFGADS